jgi:hypothetical protein
MKKTFLHFIILGFSIFISCSTQKKVLTVDDLSSDKILIIGLIEDDYTQLKHKNIKGVELIVDSKQDYSDFRLSNKYLPKAYAKKYKFICKIGNRGDYKLSYKNRPETPETDRLLTVMDHQRNENSDIENTLLKYSIKDGKIIDIGKLTVRYFGGNTETGSIKYSYSFHMDDNDTTAVHAFKQSYPIIYEKYKNDIYIFKNEFQKCLEYVLSHISEGKRLFIKNYIENNPDRINIVFNNLSPITQNKYIEIIEKLTFDQLDEFVNKTE